MKKFKEYCEEAREKKSVYIPIRITDLYQILFHQGIVTTTTLVLPEIEFTFEGNRYKIESSLSDPLYTILSYIGDTLEELEKQLFS